MKKWQIENSETSEIWEILFRVFLFPSFQFGPIAKIEKLDLKISEKNFRVFRLFDLASFPNSEAVTRSCYVKKFFSEISQNSQENTSTRASF